AVRAFRGAAAKLADLVEGTVARAVGSGVRRRIVDGAPEIVELEQAVRAAHQQLRDLTPLAYLRELDTFLRTSRPDPLQLNGGGAFQLMAREHWEALRGYPEFETFSMNIDGLLSCAAHAAGIAEQVLDMPIYHLEHEKGSGWSPEGEAIL